MNLSELMNGAVEYILLHLEENVTAGEVADFCHVSRFYFTRMFKEQTGESVYAFIKKKKLEFSAFRLKAEAGKSITEIAGEFGYSSSNYSAAFKAYFEQSPIAFRHERLGAKGERLDPENRAVRAVLREIDALVRLEEKPPYQVVYERCIGNYREMKENWTRFCAAYDPFSTRQTLYFERTFDDPSIADQNKCLYDLAMSDEGLRAAAQRAGGLERLGLPPEAAFGTINGGKFAVCPFRGYLSEIAGFHQKLMGIWLPLSGYHIDSRYSYDLYHTVETDTYYMEFDICIPIR